MRKKIKNIRLLLVFSVLLVLVVILFTNKNGQKERSFKKQLIEFNAEDINHLKLYPRLLNGESLELKKEGESWIIETNNKSFHASNNTINGMISTLQNLEVKSLAATKKDKWEEFHVNDSLSSRVQLFKDSKKVADIYIGKFLFTQPRTMSSFVRLNGKKETYKVDGYLQRIFNRYLNDLRDKTIIDDRIANWVSMSFDYPADSSFVLSKSDNKWMVEGVLADSAQVVNFINSIKTQQGNKIIDGNKLEGQADYKLTIERENLSPVIIYAKHSGDEIMLQSSENNEAMFNDKSIAENIFLSKSKFQIK